jgi:hypothetical protein
MPKRQPPPDRGTDRARREAGERQDAEVAAATRAVRPKSGAPSRAGLVSELLASGGLARQVSARGHAGVAPRRPRGVAADFARGVGKKPQPVARHTG